MLAAAIVAVAAYSPALRAPFDFDDFESVVNNPTIATAWPPTALVHTPARGTPVSGRPFANYSFALNRAFAGADASANGPGQPVGYRAVNLALHILTGILLYVLIRDLLERSAPERVRQRASTLAAVTAALWLIHPIQTEAVDYVSQRTEILVSLFYALMLWASVRAWTAGQRTLADAGSNTRWWSAAAVVACALGMASKEVMVTAPFALLLLDRVFLYTSWRDPWVAPHRRSRTLLYIALLLTTGIAAALTLSGGRSTSAGFASGMPWYRYLYTQAWAVPHYLRLVIWPTGLTFDYGMRPVTGAAGIPGACITIVLLAGCVAAWLKPKTWPYAFWASWFFLLLAPSSSVIPIATEVAAERRMYLALAPLLLLIVIGIDAACRRMVAAGRTAAQAAARVAFAAVFVTLAALTFSRSALYARPVDLWRDTIRKRPSNVRAYDNLAAALMRESPPRLDAADSVLRQAISLDSTYTPSLVRAASIAIHRSDLATAKSLLERALRVSPDDEAATVRYAKVLLALNAPDRALPYLRRIVAVDPGADAFVDLANAYVGLDRLDSAAIALRRAMRLDPSRIDAARDLSGLLVETNHGADAVPLLEPLAAAPQPSPFDVAVLSLALAQAGRADQAFRAATRSVSLPGADVATLVFAGRAMLTLRRTTEAVQYLSAAVHAAPQDAHALAWLGIATAQAGKRDEAIDLLKRAAAMAPDYDVPRQALQSLMGTRR